MLYMLFVTLLIDSADLGPDESVPLSVATAGSLLLSRLTCSNSYQDTIGYDIRRIHHIV
jgi:hypothetical protein